MNHITNWNVAHNRIKRIFFLFVVVIVIIGNLVDVIKPRTGFSVSIVYINTFYIILSLTILILYLLRVIKLHLAAIITLYAILINIFISTVISTPMPDFEVYYMREMMILGILIIPVGYILNKTHVLIFGTSIFCLFTGISFSTESIFLRENYYLLLIVLFSYTFWVYYIMLTLEKWIFNQNELIKKLEQKNKSIEKKTEQLNRINTTKDRIFSIIAHDLKNPFNSIIGFSDLMLLKHKQLDNKKTDKYLKIINHAAIESENLLNNILSWATSQTSDISFNPLDIELKKLFKSLKSHFNASCEAKEIELNFNDGNIESIVADGNMLITILRNLISNAIKYSRPKGSVEVKSSRTKTGYLFEITDNGVGISKADLDKLFISIGSLQKTGTSREKGTGLGLIICKDLVERHKGELHIQSEPEKGSTFSFTIPVSPASPED